MSSGSSDAGNVSPSPASILLAKEVQVAFGRNHTTARAERLGVNSTVEVTFWIADPPDMSFYTLYCNPLMAIPDGADMEVIAPIPVSKRREVCVRPRVVGAEGGFVLLSTLFSGRCSYEYFMYKSDPKSPSLESLPLPDDDFRLRGGKEFAIVPRGDDGHYQLFALCRQVKMNNYRLHIYSSADAAWTTKDLPNPCPGKKLIMPNKVFVMRDGLLLWVDLLQGILVWNVLQGPHHAKFIPLPEPLPGNREPVKQLQQGVRGFRDLTCVNGLIKLIEIEHREIIEREIPEVKLVDPRTMDVICDSDLINQNPVKPETRVSVDGWIAITWTRNIGSTCWRKGHIVDVDDILVDDSVFSAFLSSEKSESAESLTFKNLYPAWPALSTDGNDILYLKSTSPSGVVALVSVDLAEKKALKVEALKPHPLGKYFYVSPWQIFRPCALANHLEMTPGIETSASQIALMGSSANEPNNTAIHVGETDSYESQDKRPRLSAEKVNHAQNGARSTVQNVLIPQAHPNQNNLPSQLQFNRWEQPGYIRYSSWTHQNIPPPPQCFNKLAVPFNPVYTPMLPAPIMHSYGNYQSLEQEAPRTFGPHEAPHQLFNNWCGARYIGNSPQHPAGNSYSYGAPSGSGNHHQHR